MKTTTTAFAKLLAGIILLAGINYSCKKDMASPTPTPVTPVAPVIGPFTVSLPVNTVSFSVSGKVLDDQNNPVPGAVITGGGITVTTDNNGYFKIRNGSFNGTYASIKIEKANYFTLVKTMTANSSRMQYIVGKLSPKVLAGTVGAAGGTVQFGSGNVSLVFSENSFINSAGNLITGNVDVYATYIDPTQVGAANRMPGNLSAVDAPSTTYLLKSFGMMGIELKDADGQQVKLAPGKTAGITANIPAALVATAPASIPLWYFDEGNAVWVKEGAVTKTGTTYKGEVAHFTFWNMDMYYSFCFFQARYLNRADSSALPYSNISFNGVGEPHVYYETTDAGGYTYGMIPTNTPLQMRFYKADGTVLLDTIIGPYSNTQNDIGNVYINFPPTVNRIHGTLVDCDGQSITYGSVTATIDSLDYVADLNSDGEFSIPLTVPATVNTHIVIIGVDSATNNHSHAIGIVYNGSSDMSTGFLTTCPTGVLPEFITYDLDGVKHHFTRNIDSAFCSRTYAFNRTNTACRRANGSPQVEGYVAFITGPSTSGGTDTSSILTLEQYSTASSPSSLNIISFDESYYEYPVAQGVEGWVTGRFTCIFTDAANIPHTVKSNFKMWRRN